MSDLDKIRQAFPDLRNASDSDVLGEVSRLTGVRFEDVADVFGVAPRGTIGESVRQLGAGLAVDLPRMTGQALKYTGIAPELGESLVEGAERRAPGFTPDMRGRGLLGQALTSGARGLGPVAASVPLFFVPGGQVVAPAALGTLFGTSSAQDTYEKLVEQGIAPEEAAAAARRVGLLQGGGEAAATAIGARTILPIARSLRGARTTGEVTERLTDTSVLRPFAQRLGLNVGVQAGTEAAQDVGTELIERSYGARPEDIGEIAQQSALAGGGMALWLGPFTFGGSVSRARRSEELKQALYGENVDPQVRAQAMDFVMAEAQRQNIAPENIDTWFETQLEIEDSRTAALAAAEARAAAEAQANRDKSLEDMVKQQGLTRGLTDQDLLTPGVTSAQIDRELGIGRKPQDPKKYVKNFTQAFDEPSGQFVSDPETGVERELTVGEYYQRQGGVLDLMQEEPTKAAVATEVATQTLRDPRALFLRDTLGIIPTPSALQLVDAIEQAGISTDADIVSPVITFAADKPLTPKRLERALQMLDAAIIESRRAAPTQQAVAPVVSIPGVSEPAGVSPAAAPAVAGFSQGAPVATPVPQAPVGAPAPAAPAAAAQEQIPAPAPQAVNDGYASDAEAWDDFRAEDAPTFDQLSPGLQQTWADARRADRMSREITELIVEENQGEGTTADPRVTLLAQLFDGKNALRNAEMFIDRAIMGMSLKDVAEKYGLSISGVGKIVGDEKDAAARMTATLNRARARGLNMQAIQDAMRSLAETARERNELDIQNMFGDVEATGADAAQADLGTRVSSAGGSGANIAAKLTPLEQRARDLLEAIAGVTDSEVKADLEKKLAETLEKYRTLERQIQAEVRSTISKGSAREQAISDYEIITSGEGLPAFEDLSKAKQKQVVDLAKANGLTLESIKKFVSPAVAELGVEDAVQEQTAAEVPVQPEARGRQKVGRQVRRAQEPATEGQGQARQATIAKANRSGTFTFKHASQDAGKKRFEAAFEGDRYDGYGGTFGQQGVYLDNTGEWTGGRYTGFSAPNVYEVRANFNKAFVLSPKTADSLAALLRGKQPPSTRPDGRPIWGGEDVVAELRRQGYDAIVVEGFGSDGLMVYDTATLSREDRAALKTLTDANVSTDVTQPQVFAFNPAGLEITGVVREEGQVAQTTQEKYAQVVSAVPGAPAFADLTAAQQDQITDLANRDQLNLAAVNRVVAEEPSVGLVSSVARGMTRTGGMTDLSGNNVDLTPTTVEALTQVDVLAEVFESYRQMGWGNSLSAVKNWYVTSTPVTWDGVFAMVDGQPSVVLNARVLMTLPEESAWTLRHEIGHAIDQVQHGGNFSAGSLFNVSVTDDRIIPRGQLMQDVVNFRNSNPNSELAQHLKYPLDMQHTGRLSVDELRQEVFGQLWAFYSGSQANRDFMEDNLPFVFDYFDQGVNNEVKSTDYESDAGGQAQSASQQEQAITQAESIEPRPVRSPQQVQGVIRAHTRQPRGTVQQNLNRVPAPARGAASSMVSILGDVGGRVLDRLVFTSDLTNRAVALGMQSAGRLQRALAARDFMAREEERSIESILNGYTDLPDNERGTGDGSVNRFLFDSTRSGKWGYGDRADAELAKRFDAFSGPAKKFIQDVFAHGDRMLQRKKDLVLEATKSEFDAQIAAAKTEAQKADLRKAKQLALKRYETLFKIREGRPYAPIKRTGNYVVIAKSKEYLAAEAAKDKKRMEQLESDGDHYHVSFTDGKLSGQELRRQLEEQGAFADVQLAERDQVTDELFSNEGALQQLSKLRSNVDARVREGDKSATKLLNIINQMYLEALAEGSARKSEMKRRGVDGEVDMISSFALQGRADANFLASLQYADPVNDALNAMRAEAKTGDRTRKSEVLNELVRRYSDSLEVPNNPWLDKLTRLTSIYFLATSPAYYLQNLTQPFMMSVPAMAGRHSYTTVNNELFKAYGELGPVMKSAKLLQQLDYGKVPADVRNAINELVNRGRIDIGLDTELGEFQVDPNSKLGAKWNQVDKGLRMAVQKGEAINRLSTAIAAYRLEFAKAKDAQKAIDYADRILLETHGDYSRSNAPRMFNHPVGKVALQFRKFQLIQLSWYAKLIKQAYSDPVQRGAALRSLAFGLAHTGVLAGAMGLPGYAAIAWILGSLFGDEDEPFDLTDSIRKMIGDPEVANVILRGVPTLGGGDWSGKIGAGNMLSVMPFSNADLTTRAGFYEAMGTLVGGASAGMVVRGIDGLGLLANGDYLKGTELLLPKGLGDVIKAYRLGTDGATRRNGDVILPESELSGLELAWQAIGIPPAQMTTMYEKQQRVRNVEQRFRDRTTSIKNAYTKAIRQGDSADAAKAREDWKNLQDARVRAGLKRQPFSELVRAPREQAKRERETAGGVQFRRGTERMVEDIVER